MAVRSEIGQISSMITAKRNKAGEIIRDEKGKVSLPRLPQCPIGRTS